MTEPSSEPPRPDLGAIGPPAGGPIALKYVVRVVLPIAILALSADVARRIWNAAPEASRRQPPPSVVSIDVEPIARRSFQITLESRGVVRAPTESRIAALVAGRVIEVSEPFHDGGFFRAGELLVRIDAEDHELAVRRLREELNQAKGSLTELDAQIIGNARQVRLAQELVDLHGRSLTRIRSLLADGMQTDADLETAQRAELTARTRLEELRAEAMLLAVRRTRVGSAVALGVARLEEAELAAQRTRIVAPYHGRVRRRSVDAGDYVTAGTPLATIYAVDRAEVRLPLTDRQLAFCDLPVGRRERDDGLSAPGDDVRPAVELTVDRGATRDRWTGEVVRTEGAVDPESRQLFVVARVDDPYGQARAGRPPLRVGTFVRAAIEGRTLEGVFVVPRALVHGEDEILIVDRARGVLVRRRIEVAWRAPDVVVFRADDIDDGAFICTTPVVFAGDEVAVRIRGERAERPERGERADPGGPPR